jgi:hypothetical protein
MTPLVTPSSERMAAMVESSPYMVGSISQEFGVPLSRKRERG